MKKWGSGNHFLGAELKKACLGVRKPQNAKKKKIDFFCGKCSETPGDDPRGSEKMLRPRFGVEKRFLMRPDLFLNGKSGVF